MRVAGTPSAMARAFTLKRSGVRYSSRSTSPGCTARMRLTGRPISILLSVIVHDLDIGRTGHGPHKAHPPLVVDANAPLTDASALERFEPISRRRADEIQGLGCVQHGELASQTRCVEARRHTHRQTPAPWWPTASNADRSPGPAAAPSRTLRGHIRVSLTSWPPPPDTRETYPSPSHSCTRSR